MAGGWFISSSPINTADWNAESDDQWTIPVGGGIGRIFRTGSQAMSAQAHVYYNAVKPENAPAPDWTLRLQVTWMYPK
jgi:hypothetical protein